MFDINYITLILVLIFVLPIAAGILAPFSRDKVLHSLGSLLDNLEFIGGLILSVYFTKRIFFEHTSGLYREIYEKIPSSVKNALYGRDIMTYLLIVPVLLLLIMIFLRLLTNPLYKFVIVPLSDGLYSLVKSMNHGMRKVAGMLWSLPRSIFLVFTFALLLNFYSYYFSTPVLAKALNESGAYQFIYKNALYPMLNSNVAKQIPVLVNDSFRAMGTVLPEGVDSAKLAGDLAKQISRGNFKVIEYFNGVTLDEAIQSNEAIDAQARRIVGDEKNSRRKALLLYKWVSRNIEYDYDKAKVISSSSKGTSSGSITAFNERKGICFDYSCLYISMSRAVGLRVRLVTGLGYSGIAWGDHAWNQVYITEEKRWINVDTTFGSAGDYFDKPDFSVDHKYDEVQGEW